MNLRRLWEPRNKSNIICLMPEILTGVIPEQKDPRGLPPVEDHDGYTIRPLFGDERTTIRTFNFDLPQDKKEAKVEEHKPTV